MQNQWNVYTKKDMKEEYVEDQIPSVDNIYFK